MVHHLHGAASNLASVLYDPSKTLFCKMFYFYLTHHSRKMVTAFEQLAVCSCHVTYAFYRESLHSCMSVKELLSRDRRDIWRFNECRSNPIAFEYLFTIVNTTFYWIYDHFCKIFSNIGPSGIGVWKSLQSQHHHLILPPQISNNRFFFCHTDVTQE